MKLGRVTRGSNARRFSKTTPFIFALIASLLPVLAWAGPGAVMISADVDASLHSPITESGASGLRGGLLNPEAWSGGPTANLVACNAYGDQYFVGGVPDGAGGMITVFQDDRYVGTTGNAIFAQHILACGSVDTSWPVNGAAVTRTSGWSLSFPVAATDGAGGVYVAWWDATDDIYAQHVLADGTIDPAWPVNGLPICTAPGRQRVPMIVTDGAGGAYVAWDDARDGGPNRKIFVQHLVSTGVDPNPAWTTDGVRVVDPSSTTSERIPEICADGSGGLIVAWGDNRDPNPGLDLFAQRFDSAANRLWGPSGTPVCLAAGQQFLNGAHLRAIWVHNTNGDDQSNAMVSDGAGGAFIAWMDGRNNLAFSPDTETDVFVQHITSSGAVAAGWPADGVALSTAPDGQNGPLLIADGAGGVHATWVDLQPNVVYAQHVTAAGTISGPVNGLAISTAAVTSDFSYYPFGASDGSGGAIFTWSDERNAATGFDVFAQHLTITGGYGLDPAWAGDVDVSTAIDFQDVVGAVISDGAGGAVMAIQDNRNVAGTGQDVYAQRILADGTFPSDDCLLEAGDKKFALFPLDPMDGDQFGIAVDLEGTVGIVGTWLDDGAGDNAGSAYLFDLVTGNQTFELIGSDAAAGDQGGNLGSVGVSGNIAIVGAQRHDHFGSDAGAAYLFDATTGSQLHELSASDAAAGDNFGLGAAIDGNVAIVGAFGNDDAGASSGAAYLFDATTGIELHKLTASDAAAGDRFGFAVDIDGNVAIVGAQRNDGEGSDAGAAYLIDVTTGLETHRLTASDAATNDLFGVSVAISGNRAVVGALAKDGFTGAAYVFDVTTGAELYKLTASDAAAGNSFGVDVAIDGVQIIVGSDGGAGAAYVFELSTGTELFKFAAVGGSSGDRFGAGVAIDGDMAIAGVPNHDNGDLANSGFACVFDVTRPAPTFVTVSGNVSADCDGGLLGVTVDLDHPNGDMFTTATDANGDYVFTDVLFSTDQAVVSIVVPLGYQSVSPALGQALVTLDQDQAVDFSLACLDPQGQARSMGYWKHQANVYLKGKGNAQESQADMETNFPAAIFNHFYENELNAIVVEGVTYVDNGGGPEPLDLATIHATLSVKGNAGMLAKAKQQYLAMLLNLASGKLLTTSIVSDDGATASQALQQVAAHINDGDPSNDEVAKDIGDTINNAQLVAAGVINLGINQIAYARRGVLAFSVSPNPGSSVQQLFAFTTYVRGAVRLVLYDIAGRTVATPLDQTLAAGSHRVRWDGRGRAGTRLPAGIYMARLHTPGGTATLKVLRVQH